MDISCTGKYKSSNFQISLFLMKAFARFIILPKLLVIVSVLFRTQSSKFKVLSEMHAQFLPMYHAVTN